MGVQPTAADREIRRIHRMLRPGFGTEAAVYGIIMVSGLIAVSSAHGETSATVLTTVVVTIIVFWGAHVYAGTVVRLGTKADIRGVEVVGMRMAFEQSIQHSLGMLTSATLPTLILLAGTTRLIPDGMANDAALWSGVVLLAFLGYVAFLRRGSAPLVRTAGALGTAAFGVVFVVLKAVIH
ncbi:hypothetical protein ACWGLC_02095 [Dietzia sp. NPDC055877]